MIKARFRLGGHVSTTRLVTPARDINKPTPEVPLGLLCQFVPLVIDEDFSYALLLVRTFVVKTRSRSA